MSSTVGLCSVCNLPSTIKTFKKLSNSGLSMMAIHDADQTTHKWVKYDSIFDVKNKQRRHSFNIDCPRCGDNGRLNTYKSTTNKPIYVITHEKLDGKWGKRRDATTKHRRCYIINIKQRKEVLEILGKV